MTQIPIREQTLDLIGNTPLVRLAGPSAKAGCDIYGKCEFANPGASVKDRAALYIIRDAEARGELKPGGTVVEGTAGNTGIGIALVANALGYKCVIVMPDNQSQEKMATLRALRAELVTVPPGCSSPRASASRMIHSAARSFTEAPGLANSHLPQISQPAASLGPLSNTSGVLPIRSSVLWRAIGALVMARD